MIGVEEICSGESEEGLFTMLGDVFFELNPWVDVFMYCWMGGILSIVMYISVIIIYYLLINKFRF